MLLKKSYPNTLGELTLTDNRNVIGSKKDIAYVLEYTFNRHDEIQLKSEFLLEEAKLLYDFGFHHFLIDVQSPLFFSDAGDLTYALVLLQKGLMEIKRQLPRIVTLGICGPYINEEALMALYTGCDLDYLYCCHYIGQYVTLNGPIQAGSRKLLSLMNRYNPNSILACQLSSEQFIINDEISLLQRCSMALNDGKCQALILGQNSLENVLKDLYSIRKATPQATVYYSGGFSALDLRRVLENFDGFFINSLSKNILIKNDKLDRQKIKQFIDQVQNIIGD